MKSRNVITVAVSISLLLSVPLSAGEGPVDCEELRDDILSYEGMGASTSTSYEDDLQAVAELAEIWFEHCGQYNPAADEDVVGSPRVGDQINCQRHDGALVPFQVTETGGPSSYQYWILEELATPSTLTQSNYKYDWRAGWSNNLVQSWKGQDVRGWSVFSGNPNGWHYYTYMSQSPNMVDTTTSCGGMVVRGDAKFDQDKNNYLDIRYSGANWAYESTNSETVTVTFTVETGAKWKTEAKAWTVGGSLSGSQTFYVDFGMQVQKQITTTTKVTVVTNSHVTGGPFTQTGGGGINGMLDNARNVVL